VYDPHDLWKFLPIGYVLTVAIETPILYLALSRRHPMRDRIIAGLWLTAVTYPIVVVAMPLLFGDLEIGSIPPRITYLVIAETFAPAAECGLFYLAYIRGRVFPDPSLAPADRRATLRDFAAITIANLASFGIGEFTGIGDLVRRFLP
jgi:hypothetical protein